MPNTWNPRSLQNEINVLKRKVGRNTPAPVYFREDIIGGLYLTNNGFVRDEINVTSTIVQRTDFRNNINGDEWYNNSMKVKLLMEPTCSTCRVLVYMPLISGNEFAPPLTKEGYLRIPDPAAFTVLSDRYFNRDSIDDAPAGTDPFTGSLKVFSWNVPLRGAKTIYNGSSGVIEKNSIVILVMSIGDNNSNNQNSHRVQYLLQAQDK